MIVKGHDFPKVTLVGIIAADLSLHAGDFRAGERTFQLLCQAAGRAGRDALPGEVVIQTYQPEHYSIVTAAEGDYISFYNQEILYRTMMQYPPVAHILLLLITSKVEEEAEKASVLIGKAASHFVEEHGLKATVIGPAPAAVTKINDIYRRILYIKHNNYEELIGIKNYLEGYYKFSEYFSKCHLQFDFNPMSGY
jgi:primosomal protein N' (replication factor Y)